MCSLNNTINLFDIEAKDVPSKIELKKEIIATNVTMFQFLLCRAPLPPITAGNLSKQLKLGKR